MGARRGDRHARAGEGRGRRACALGLAVCTGLASLVAPAAAEPATLTLDPEHTRIRFEVDSTLHRVHGTVHLVRGELGFDTAGGPATGTVEVDAASAETGNGLRDGTTFAAGALPRDRVPGRPPGLPAF